MIFCYSGTGNSRYIAKRIADALHDEIIDLNDRIKEKNRNPIHSENDVVIVVPTYAWRIPRIVSEWILNTDITGARRIWFAMSCGSEIGNASDYNRQIADKKGLEYMGTAQIIMPENYIALFNAPDKEEAGHIVAKAEPDIDKAIAYIGDGRRFDATRQNLYDRFMSGPVNPIFYKLIVKAGAFRVDEKCTSCGMCVKRCALNNIELQEGKPVWGKVCTHCMACICYCPAEAIEYGRKSTGKPHYTFEELGIDLFSTQADE
ncbi:MAG: EFR1 family ferrodoxin [Bacillota bacterium]|nr:EFR1 family ferrodoxin [Bacillota bacterium]